MTAEDFSNSGLQLMHTALRDAFLKEEINSSQAFTGIRHHPDFKRWSDELEAELTKRNLSFFPITW